MEKILSTVVSLALLAVIVFSVISQGCSQWTRRNVLKNMFNRDVPKVCKFTDSLYDKAFNYIGQ